MELLPIFTSILLLIVSPISAQSDNNTFYPVSVRNGNSFLYVGFGHNFYSLALPDLSLAVISSHPPYIFNDPGTLGAGAAIFGDGNNGRITVQTDSSYAFSADPNNPAPQPVSRPNTINDCQTDAANNSYCFVYGNANASARVNKTDSTGSQVGSLVLPNSGAALPGHNFFRYFQIEGSLLYVVAATSSGRGSGDFDYYVVQTNSLTLNVGPVDLPNSANSGCPAVARECGVPVTLYMSVTDSQVVYVYTILTNGAYQVHVESYTPSCGFSSNYFDDRYLAPKLDGTSTCYPKTQSSTSPAASSATNGGTVDQTGPNCPSTLYQCGDACYTSDSYCCVNGQLTQKQFCPTSATPTSPATVPSSSAASNICVGKCAGASCCATPNGSLCYSSTNYNCTPDDLGNNYVCPSGTSSCGGACYSASSYHCKNGQLQQGSA